MTASSSQLRLKIFSNLATPPVAALHRWWWVPMVAMVGVTVALTLARSHANSVFLYQQQVDFHTLHPGQPGLPAEMPTPPVATVLVNVAGRLVSLVGNWILWIVLLGLSAILLGGREAGFGIMARLAMWSWLSYVVRGVLQIIYVLASGDPLYNPGLSGLFVDNTPPPMGTFIYTIPTRGEQVMAAILGRVDVYLIWQMALLTIGLADLSRLSRRRSVLVVTGIWLIGTGLSLLPILIPALGRLRF